MATAMPIFSNVSFKDDDLDYLTLDKSATVEEVSGHLPALLNDGFRKRLARNFDWFECFLFVIRYAWRDLADDAFGEKYLFDLVLSDWLPFGLYFSVSLDSFEQALLFCRGQFSDLGE